MVKLTQTSMNSLLIFKTPNVKLFGGSRTFFIIRDVVWVISMGKSRKAAFIYDSVLLICIPVWDAYLCKIL